MVRKTGATKAGGHLDKLGEQLHMPGAQRNSPSADIVSGRFFWKIFSSQDLEWLNYPLVNIQKTMENHHFKWENFTINGDFQ
jgi:hypothetical protein